MHTKIKQLIQEVKLVLLNGGFNIKGEEGMRHKGADLLTFVTRYCNLSLEFGFFTRTFLSVWVIYQDFSCD